MARRLVTHARNQNGRVVLVCNPEEWWSPRTVTDVAIDIETGAHTYHIRLQEHHTIKITREPATDRLTAEHNGIDHLLHLPTC